MSTDIHPPEGLLARIIRRLGLEKQLILIRRHLGVVGAFLLGSLAGALLAVSGIKQMLANSGFGPYLSLVRSDFGFVASHRAVYVSALFDSAPSTLFAASLVALTVILVCLRLAVVYSERLQALSKSIKNS